MFQCGFSCVICYSTNKYNTIGNFKRQKFSIYKLGHISTFISHKTSPMCLNKFTKSSGNKWPIFPIRKHSAFDSFPGQIICFLALNRLQNSVKWKFGSLRQQKLVMMYPASDSDRNSLKPSCRMPSRRIRRFSLYLLLRPATPPSCSNSEGNP